MSRPPETKTDAPDTRNRREWFPDGWRRSAMVNVGFLLVSLLLLVGVLIAAVRATGGINQVWMFYTADCRDNSITTVNVGLHLLLNAISTVMLASSNFFMQVLNSPSRKEVDSIHAKGDWLDIGIPSWRNVFLLSRFKAVAWICLFITSLPIHLVFNSSMFQVNTLMGGFNMTIAAESFTRDDSVFFLPGASLWTSDMGWFARGGKRFQEYYDGNYTAELERVSKSASQARDWVRLEPAECNRMYASRMCSGLRDYRDLVMVVEGDGWRRSDLWNLAGDELWESVVPRNALNSLWYAAGCELRGALDEYEPYCSSSCSEFMPRIREGKPWAIFMDDLFKLDRYPYVLESWNATLFSTPGNVSAFGFRRDSPSGEAGREGLKSIDLLYCLAEPRESTCAVAISKPLLLAVILAVFFKVVICITVIRILGPDESLVTPGDAVSSFLSIPESKPYESGPVSQDIIRKRARRALRQNTFAYGPLLTSTPTIQWVRRQARKGASVPRTVWAGTYGILILGIAVCGACFAVQLRSTIPLQWIKLNVGEARSILRGIPSAVTFMTTVVVANSPQLYLSLWYLAYNSLMTRLEMGYEWALFSQEYRPLRVTHPKGQQTSTYRLQLPYRYSVPLLIVSTLLHWLLSTALFIIVTRGDYQDKAGSSAPYVTDPISLPDDASVAIGTASLPVLVLTILGAIMILVPIAIAWVKLPGYMPVVGSNSRAMLAASRPSPIAKIPDIGGPKGDSTEGVELKQLIPASQKDVEGSTTSDAPESMAFCLLKWGEVEMSEEWYRRFDEASDRNPGLRVRHLSFGTVLDDPKPPTEGYLYA